MELDDNWFREERRGVERRAPGLYQWLIEGVGGYVGHAADLDAVPARYTNNVIRCLNGLEYHNKPSEFRPVHKALARAVRDEKRVTLTFLENVASASDRQSRKLELIKELRAVFEPQGLQILNGHQKRAT